MVDKSEEVKDECSSCRFLLHYEWDVKKKRTNLPRCCIEFRNGNEVIHPCRDFNPT